MDEQSNSSGQKRTTRPSSRPSPKSVMIATALRGYRKIYPTYGETTDPDQVKLYFRLLEDLDENVLSRALAQAAKECTAFPTPAHIRKIAERFEESAGDIEAERALAALDKLVSEWGAERLPVFRGLDPKTGEPRWKRFPELEPRTQHALNAVGGWKRYVSREEREAAFVRRDFLAAYRAYSAFAEPSLGLGAGSEDGRLLGAQIAKLAEGRTM